MKHLAVYIGRFSPLHLGHEAVITKMIEEFGRERCLILVGSANTPQSMRHFFSYSERKRFIENRFPLVHVAPLPDFPSNDEWFYDGVEDLTRLAGQNACHCQFYSGCIEDVEILSQYVKDIKFLNRFDGTTPVISATEVRDVLIHGRNLDRFIHKSIQQEVTNVFNKRWKEFQSK